MSRELPPWLESLAGSLADPGRWAGAERPGRQATGRGRPAAVLILIGHGETGPFLVFTERSATLRSHPGQVAFPGGAADPEDDGPAGTALREAEEEIGLHADGVQVFGQLPASHVAVSGFDVTAVLGWWHTRAPVRVMDPAEVAGVHLVDVRTLTDPAHRGQVRHPSGYVGPAFEIAVGPDSGGADHDLLVWGLTAHLVEAVLTLAGWQRPWNRDRELAIPDRHLHDRAPARPTTCTTEREPGRS